MWRASSWGAAIHPLNRARLDPAVGRVTYGYGILQPRVSISLESASRSKFARIFSGNTGIDPYTTAVSDVYQDLFGEGNFTGKGLYDVDAFEAALANRVPENSLLSHDLLNRCLRAPRWLPTSSCWMTIRPPTTPMPSDSIVGRAATGKFYAFSFPRYLTQSGERCATHSH